MKKRSPKTLCQNLLMRTPLILALALATLVLQPTAGRAQTVPADGRAAVPRLVGVLQSGASRKEKTDALRELGLVGTREALPVITALLADEELSHMARYALETMPDPGVNQALRQALGTLKGRQLVGVINTLGARRDPKAVKPLVALLKNPDPDTAQGAARALGSIGTKDAAAALDKAVRTTAPANLVAFGEGAMRCAEHLVAAGQNASALKLYNAVRSLPVLPHQLRAAALRGTLVANRKNAPGLLRAILAGEDYGLFAAAVRSSMDLPEPEVTGALLSVLGRVSADRKVVLLQALARRGDATALPAMTSLARTGAKPVRLAALRALPGLGQTAGAVVFADLLTDPDPEIAQLAQEGLASAPGREVDSVILRMLEAPEARQRLTGLELCSRRRLTHATAALLKACADKDPAVRTSAARRVGELAGATDVPAVLDLLFRVQPGPDQDNLAQALGSIAGRETSAVVVADQILGRLSQASSPQKAALLPVLATAGGDNALKAVRAAADDSDSAVRMAALRSLAAWKTVDASPDLLALAKASPNASERLLCLRGYFAWASAAELPADKRFEMCTAAAGVVQEAEDKKLLLGALGSLHTPTALERVLPYLKDAAIREEAAAAVASIADDLVKSTPKPAGLAEALKSATDATTNADLGKRLNVLLQKAGQ